MLPARKSQLQLDRLRREQSQHGLRRALMSRPRILLLSVMRFVQNVGSVPTKRRGRRRFDEEQSAPSEAVLDI